MENKKKIRLVLSIVLFFIVLSAATYIIKNKDVIFTSITKIQYPDGCIEEYKNDELISPICKVGRELHELQKEGKTTKGYGDTFEEWTVININLTE